MFSNKFNRASSNGDAANVCGKRMSFFWVLSLALLAPAPLVAARVGSGAQRALLAAAGAASTRAAASPDLSTCTGRYALCAAADCTRLAANITVTLSAALAASSGAATASFPAASCTCPILTGSASAKPGSGNMPSSSAPDAEGVCSPPVGNAGDSGDSGDISGGDTLWSLYANVDVIPQAPSWDPSATKPKICNSMRAGFANCFSFSCVQIETAGNGQELALCTCPINEAATGAAVPPTDIAIKSKAGCGALVVGTDNPMNDD